MTLAIIWLLAWSLGYHYLRGWTPLARDFDWPQRTPHHQLLTRFTDQIPAEAPLSATPPLHPHLAHREKIYVFPTVADAEFVLLDVSSRIDSHPNDVRATYDALVESGEYGVVDAAEGYVLLARERGSEGDRGDLPDAFYDFARVEDVQPQYPALVEFDNRLRLLGYDVIDDPKWGQTYLRYYWQALAPLPDDMRLWPFVYNEDGFLIEDTSKRPMVAPLWYPPPEWQPGEVIVTETLPRALGPHFNVGLAVLRTAHEGDGAGDPVAAFNDPLRRFPITAAGSGLDIFHGDTWAQVGAFARDGRDLAPATDDPPLRSIDINFDQGIRLTHYKLSDIDTLESSAHSPISSPYSPISVVLQWQPTTPIPGSYTVFVHLVDTDGTVVSQSDAQPGWVTPWPTNYWLPHQPVLDSHQLSLPPDLSPGRYQVQVGLYDWETLERLSVLDGATPSVADHVVLSEIEIGP
jgi:hypothetical protein